MGGEFGKILINCTAMHIHVFCVKRSSLWQFEDVSVGVEFALKVSPELHMRSFKWNVFPYEY